MKTNIKITTSATGTKYDGLIKNATKKLDKEISKRIKENRLTPTGMAVAIKLAFGHNGSDIQVNTEFAEYFAGMWLFRVYINGTCFGVAI